MNASELADVLEKHRLWLRNEPGCVMANLSWKDLREARLDGASLDGASLVGARLDGASLDGASLDGARLDGARLDGARLDGARLDGARLVGARLDGASLVGASLVGARLVGASLVGARLDGASLVGASLVGARLVGASLVGASLVGARLDGASLDGASLDGARLDGASLDGASLDGASLDPIKADLYAVLDVAPGEVLGLYDAIMRGRIDGRYYSGDCCCLVGTIAKCRRESFGHLTIQLKPNASRFAEVWFLAIRPGHTPSTSPIASITAGWVREWLVAHGQAVPEYRIVSSLEAPALFATTAPAAAVSV